MVPPDRGAWFLERQSETGRDGHLIGIGLFVLGLTCASTQAGLSKLLAESLPFIFVVWGRFAVFLLVCLPMVIWRHGLRGLRLPQPHLHLWRGLLLLVASVAFIWAISGMPLANAIAIVFVYPFLVTALSPLVLKERVPKTSWVAVVAGFVGVLVVIRPETDVALGGIDWHALLALAAGSCFGIHLLITRRLTASSPPLITASATALVSVVVLSLAVPFNWQTPSGTQFAIFLVMGSFGAASQLLTIFAVSRAPMPTLAPFGYSEIVAATLVGLVLFGDFPDATTWIGIAIIVASGLVIALAARHQTRIQLISRTRPPAH